VPYLIDGHNLIAQMPGITLGAVDDEAQLIGLLRIYCERTRSRATVYFDRGHPQAESPPAGGRVTARFVPSPRSADQAIIRHLERLGGDARNWTVVSSDREIQQAAARGARRVAARVRRLVRQRLARPGEARAYPLSKEDVAYWEKARSRSPAASPGFFIIL
jgi:predicted RNA-binding protein with PIN domain